MSPTLTSTNAAGEFLAINAISNSFLEFLITHTPTYAFSIKKTEVVLNKLLIQEAGF